MIAPPALRLSPLEVAAGFPVGGVDGARLPDVLPVEDLVSVLEDILVDALEHPPCVVSFSGGRDSSAVLALACRVAAKEGLAAPIPVSLRFPGAHEANEDDWQELVVRHLSLADWVRVDFSDELDLIGPAAADVLLRHGLLWPPNTHFHAPILRLAEGGSILTGIDGDGVFGSWRWLRLAQVLRLRARPRPLDLARLVGAMAPVGLRRAFDRRAPGSELPWLLEEAQASLDEALSFETAEEPARWASWTEWYWRRRSMQMVLESFELLARDHSVRPVHPFAHPSFLRALGHHGTWLGPGNRTDITRALAGDLLPAQLITRRSKAALDLPFWNAHARAFARGWTGRGVDPDLVDPERLRSEWLSAAPHAAASSLLQAAWLADVCGP